MTKREFLNAVIEGTAGDEAVEYAQAELAKMDSRNANRKPTKTQLANRALYEPIVEIVKEANVVTASEVAEALEISTQKASALLRALVKEGQVEAITPTKKGDPKAYTVVTA